MAFTANGASIRDGIIAIQNGGAKIALAVDDSETLVGIITDGYI